MRQFLIGVLLVAVIALGVSFYMNWLNISWASKQDNKAGVAVTVDKSKFKQDLNAAKNKASELANDVRDGLTGHQTVKGVVQWLDPEHSQITLAFDGLRTLTANVDASTKVFLGNREGTLSELQEGDTVTMDTAIKSGQLLAVSVRDESVPDNQLRGVVQWFDRDHNQITLGADLLRTFTANVDANTKVFIGNREGSLAEVKEGDTVTMDTIVKSGHRYATTLRDEAAY